ncbi:hypothetical protein BOTBODRAFT_34746 [Botryobasidium botryosum FD-172 SS1]|uniref:Condensation domain-containing protein n=1 Tax=Botryobasidium botryosum (strain FD-172 SS1) TaxID=930990 RepID=A0A067MJR7_BOTB1|nr:hypothetical protein BOTBODRAFT_34746 [Botryobasidium botryosum FD-172 SS1]
MSTYTWAPSASNPKRWSRRMYGTDAFLTAVAESLSCLCSFTIGVSFTPTQGTVTPSDIRRAWILTRHECPIVAVQCQPPPEHEEDPLEFAYPIETLSEVEKWADGTVRRCPDAPAGSDIFATMSETTNAFNNTDGPYPHEGGSAVRLSWCLLGDGKSIGLLFHVLHASVDGRGAFDIMGRTLKNLGSSTPIASLRWGEEVARLPNPVPIIAGLWKPSDEPTAEYMEWVDNTVTKMGLTDDPFLFPARTDESPSPTLIHREFVQLPSSAFKKFRDTCKRHDLTATEVIIAILYIAQSTPMERHYKFFGGPLPDTPGTVSFFPVDPRRYIKDEHTGNAMTLANIPLDLPLLKKAIDDSGCLERGKELKIGKVFWEEFTQKLKKEWRDETESQDTYAYSHEWMKTIVAGLEGIPDAHKTIGPLMSSLGTLNAFVASQYRSETLAFDTRHIHIAFRSIARSIVSHWWSFNGMFIIQCGACDEFYPVNVVREMMEEVKRWIDVVAAESDAKARL